MEKKIPARNYLILLILSIITIVLVFYLATWYKTSQEYYKNNSILSNYLSEIHTEEISSYLLDTPEVVIYAASSKDETIKPFEKEFKKLLEEHEIKNNVLYLNTSKEENAKFVEEIKKWSNKKITELPLPNLIYFKDGKIKAVMYKGEKVITKRDANNFLIKNGMITND